MARTQNERATVELILNGQQAKTTLKEVSLEATRAQSALRKMKETDPGYKEKLKEAHALINAQREMSARINDTSTMWGRFKKEAGTVLTGVVGGNIATAGLQALVGLIPDAIDKSIKLKDELADVAKAADMSDSEVKNLKKSLKDMPTRTATKDLMAMAEVGGQFGVPKAELEGFVDGMNKVNVAIGKDFGGVEELTDKIMPLRNIFRNIKSDRIDQDILHIGNALNVLEADGAATSPVMADFASRMGGVLVPLGVAEGKVLGMAATFQELNVTAERGSTAVVNIFQKMLTESSTFAKVAGVPLKEYRDLLNKDIGKAFDLYVAGLKKVSGNQTEFMAVLEKSKLTGAGEMEVLSKLASNSEMLAKKTDMATQALTGTDSIMGEYNKKNFELAVNMKKLSEWFGSLMGSLSPFAESIVNLTVKVLGLNDAAAKSTQTFEDQKTKVATLEKTLPGLLDKYDKLKAISKPTQKDQQELSNVIGQIADIVPSAATSFDKYGNAIDISTQKARENIRVQKELLKYYNRDAIDETRKELTKLDQQLLSIANQRKTGTTVDEDLASSGYSGTRKLTDDELKDLKKKSDNVIKLRQEVATRLQGLNGEYLNKPKPAAKPKPAEQKPSTPPKPAGTIDLGETAEEKKERLKKERAAKKGKKASDDALKWREDIERLKTDALERISGNEKDEFAKEEYQFGEHYAKLLKLAMGHEKEMAEVADLMNKEQASIQKKEQDRQEKKRQKELEDKGKSAIDARNLGEQTLKDKWELERERIKNQVDRGGLSADAGQMAELQAENVYLLAKKALWQKYYDDIKKLGITDKEFNEALEKNKKKTDEDIRADLDKNLSNQLDARLKHVEETDRQEIESARSRKLAIENILGETLQLMQINWDEQLKGVKEFWSKATVVQKAAFIASKAFSAAQATVQYGQALMNIWANSGTPWAAVGFSALATATYVNVLSKIASANYSAPAFADGGYTDKEPGGYVDSATLFQMGSRRFIAGERGREFVVSNTALQNPVVADFTRMLDVAQRSNNYGLLQSTGLNRDGYYTFGQSGGSGQTSAPSGGMSHELGMAMLQQLQQNNQLMAALAERPIKFDLLAHERAVQQINDVRMESTI